MLDDHHASVLAEKPDFDIVVAGSGSVGLVLAIGLAREGFKVLSLGPSLAPRNGRTVALLDGSVRMLQAIGVWPGLLGRSAPLAVMRIVDDTGSLFRVPPVNFRASELGLAAFGHNVENTDLVEGLADIASRTPGLTRSDALLASHAARRDHVEALTAGRTVTASLLVAADGVHSASRDRASIRAHQAKYPQTALTATLAHTVPHGSVSTEFHTRQGPFTLVPLPPRSGSSHRSSMVWVMSPEDAARRLALHPNDLAREVETQSRSLLGSIRPEEPLGQFRIGLSIADKLIGPRLVLAGEAAHALPPIGAQGLNLSSRDVATLIDHLIHGRSRGQDPGDASVLAAYERARMGDVAMRSGAVDMLNRALLSPVLPMDLLRGAGLLTLGRMSSLRRAIMRQGLMPSHATPTLMR